MDSAAPYTSEAPARTQAAATGGETVIPQSDAQFLYTEGTLVHEFVDKIIVHAPDKSSGHRVQQIEIHYNFVGEIDLSHETATMHTVESKQHQQKERQTA